MTGTLDSSGEPTEVLREPRVVTRDGYVSVTFRVDAREGIDRVSIVGDFNDWSPEAQPMVRRGGHFSSTVRLVAGRRHRYQFVVDGNRWENDWRADDYEETASGAFVSVVDLRTSPGARSGGPAGGWT